MMHVGDIMSTLGDIQYIRVFNVNQRKRGDTMSTSGYYEYIGGYHDACGGYHEYIGGYSVHQGFQCKSKEMGGYHEYIGIL